MTEEECKFIHDVNNRLTIITAKIRVMKKTLQADELAHLQDLDAAKDETVQLIRSFSTYLESK